jgi:hypothetical protein
MSISGSTTATGGEWKHFEPEASFGTNVNVPESKALESYDDVRVS